MPTESTFLPYRALKLLIERISSIVFETHILPIDLKPGDLKYGMYHTHHGVSIGVDDGRPLWIIHNVGEGDEHGGLSLKNGAERKTSTGQKGMSNTSISYIQGQYIVLTSGRPKMKKSQYTEWWQHIHYALIPPTEWCPEPYIPPHRFFKQISNLLFKTQYAIDLKPGDHVYKYSGLSLYTHHGIVDADGYIIHNVYRRNRPHCRYTTDGGCPRYFGDRECGILKTCIECFKGESELHKYRYGYEQYSSWNPIDGGTTTNLEKSPDPEEILGRARDSLENNNFGKFDLQHNNSEDFAVYCSTGRKWIGEGDEHGGLSLTNAAERETSTMATSLLATPTLDTMPMFTEHV